MKQFSRIDAFIWKINYQQGWNATEKLCKYLLEQIRLWNAWIIQTIWREKEKIWKAWKSFKSLEMVFNLENIEKKYKFY